MQDSALQPIVVDEAAQRQALRQDLEHRGGQSVRAVTAARSIVLRDQAADRDAREVAEQWQHRPPDRSADILEVHVDPVWTSSRQLGWKIGCTMIDRGVEAKVVFHERAFLRAAGNADGPRARELRELADQRPDRSARRCDHHSFTGLRFADQVQTGISRQPWHTEHAETGAFARRFEVTIYNPFCSE